MFSNKYGYKETQEVQIEYVSNKLRQRIWNLYSLNEIKRGMSAISVKQALCGEITISEKILDRFGLPVEVQNTTPNNNLEKKVLQFFEWYEIYDFIEIHLSFLNDEERVNRKQQYNKILEEENSGYKIVGYDIVPITNKDELACVEKAMETEFESVNVHIKKATHLLSHSGNYDYENSVKESISAVEAMCCIITEMTGANATLGKALKKLKENGVHIHTAMENAFSALYGYTSGENGIRHGGVEFTNVPLEDAKYMLISCSAFINYLIEKWNKCNKVNEK